MLPEPKATTAVAAGGNVGSSTGMAAAPLTIQVYKRRRTHPIAAAAPAVVWKPEFKVGRRFVTEADQAMANAEVSLALLLMARCFQTLQKLCVVMERFREKDAALVHANSMVTSLSNQVKELKRNLSTARKTIDAALFAEAEAKSARAHANEKLKEAEVEPRRASALLKLQVKTGKTAENYLTEVCDDDAKEYARQLVVIWDNWYEAGWVAGLKAANVPADSRLYTWHTSISLLTCDLKRDMLSRIYMAYQHLTLNMRPEEGHAEPYIRPHSCRIYD
ncbi:hypothetical protein RHMOL_Rhmol08G0015300 [Rhododendron molle]|uniref:Uncharacterized protein n=1 Tax=Rhododendron molle TaxID=49168 RepID=A0ACC0MJP8_RHOML|nr:hypothetical protein RHMOL_Rhmol08G0015300 [Rhododendron molle]